LQSPGAGRWPAARAWFIAVVLAVPGIARAHIVPIPPSVCGLAPLEVRVPATGLAAAAPAPGPGDSMRIVYDASTSQIQVCPADPADPTRCGPAVPRPFELGAASGTIAFPPLFAGAMLSSGDIRLQDVPLAVTLDGWTGAIPVTLTTGLVAIDGAVAEGTPLRGLESFTLVGVLPAAALPPSIGGSALLTVSCQPRPVPDKDQFTAPLLLTSIRGRISATRGRLRAVASVAGPLLSDLADRPLLVAVDAGPVPVASGLIAAPRLRGKRSLTGTTDDRRTTITIRQPTPTRVVVTVQLRAASLPAQAGGPVLVALTLDGGGHIGRGEGLFRASRNGTRLQ
jgi:hypothetical protein